jgi:hypothetical protein
MGECMRSVKKIGEGICQNRKGNKNREGFLGSSKLKI